MDAYGNPNKFSAFAEHLIEEGHNLTSSSFELLHRENSYRRRIASESIEIRKHVIDLCTNLLNKFVQNDKLIEKVYPSNNDVVDL